MTGAARVGLIVAVGLLVGVATQIGQSLLPDGVSHAANSISPWLLAAFLLGSRMPDRGWAALAGSGALAVALVGYYAMVQLRFGYGGSTGALALWGIGAIVGGPVFGVAGWTWQQPMAPRTEKESRTVSTWERARSCSCMPLP